MIVCSHCLHRNPNEAVNCEVCDTRLPEAISCPNCGSSIQDPARFCGQCGFNLQLSMPQSVAPIDALGTNSDALFPDPLPPEPVFSLSYSGLSAAQAQPQQVQPQQAQPQQAQPQQVQPQQVQPHSVETVEGNPDPKGFIEDGAPHTQRQLPKRQAALLHEQSNTLIEFQPHQKVIHIGKPNDRVPPDINVSVYPSSEVVSRVHADLHIEDGTFFVEDVGSANGTYLNNVQLTPGTRYRLRTADRICLGKGDLVTFVFQTS